MPEFTGRTYRRLKVETVPSVFTHSEETLERSEAAENRRSRLAKRKEAQTAHDEEDHAMFEAQPGGQYFCFLYHSIT
jgi:hypothetical protein